jgi:hypothetical protein
MLIFSYINFVTAAKPRHTDLATGGQDFASQLVVRLSSKLRIAHHAHLLLLSNLPLAFVLV